METQQDTVSIVRKLTFNFLSTEIEKEKFWRDSAEKLIGSLERGENTGIIAETTSGKTIISLIAAAAYIETKGYRVLFLVPSRGLAYQHETLLKNIGSELQISTKVLIGGIKGRMWNDPSISIIFATPQMFMRDCKRGTANIENFNIVVLDEFHKTVGKYDYVKIAKNAEESGVKIIGLSAFPGAKEEKITKLKKSAHITKLLRAKRETPKKIEEVAIAEMDETLRCIEEKFIKLFRAVEKEIISLGFSLRTKPREKQFSLSLGKIITLPAYQVLLENELDFLFSKIENAPQNSKEKWKCMTLYAIYRKLKHAYKVCLTESYHTFIMYVEGLEKDDSKAAKRILKSPVFKEILFLANRERENHPKVSELLKIARLLHKSGTRGVIFVAEKTTGEYLKSLFNKKEQLTEVVFGGNGKSEKKLAEAIEKLKRKKLFFLIATSVIEEGLNVPEIGVVVHYSMPITEISRIQRSGRTARTTTGNVVFIMLNHQIDKSRYWKTFWGEKRMKEIMEEMEEKETREIPSLSQTHNSKKARCALTLDLFATPA